MMTEERKEIDRIVDVVYDDGITIWTNPVTEEQERKMEELGWIIVRDMKPPVSIDPKHAVCFMTRTITLIGNVCENCRANDVTITLMRDDGSAYGCEEWNCRCGHISPNGQPNDDLKIDWDGPEVQYVGTDYER